MPARSLVIGLDGADLRIVHALGRHALPNLFALMDEGAHAPLESVRPAATLPNWATFLTGMNPGKHGLFDFTLREGYRVRFTMGTIREAPTLAARLDASGLACAMIGFPTTYPPERLARGWVISGWDSPVAFEADPSFVSPPALYEVLRERFGALRFDDVDEFHADRPGFIEALPGALAARIARKVALTTWALAQRPWDLMAVYFGESDTASHYLYGCHDPASPRHPAGIGPAARGGLAHVYRALDEAVGELRRAAGGGGCEVTVVSDHGSGGASDKVLYLNRALADAGLLRFRRRTASRSWGPAWLKRAALTRLPPAARQRMFGLFGGQLPSLLESHSRFGAIDFDHTAAFSEELNYFPSVCLNLQGREPAGTVAPWDAARVRRRVEEALFALRDPWSGRAVVTALHAREDLFAGPFVSRAPDLIVELALDGDTGDGEGYSYNMMPTPVGDDGRPFRRLSPSEFLGRKGRSLPGSHRSHGLFVAAGPRVRAAGRIEAQMADAGVTLLPRLGMAVPPDCDGRVLFEVLRSARSPGVPTAAPSVAAAPGVPATPTRQDDLRVEARLRALGYVD